MITTHKLSKYKQKLHRLIDQIDSLAFVCAHQDPLIQGVPSQVFRKCGKPSCGCFKDSAKRHGPYLVVQVVKEGKQKQVALKKSQKAIWQKAKNYQTQRKNYLKLKQTTEQLNGLVKEIIQLRTEGINS